MLSNLLRGSVQAVSGTPLYGAARWAQDYYELVSWARGGFGNPPPHRLKQAVLRRYARQFGIRILVETGTYRGDMVQAMRAHFDSIYSIELSAELHAAAVARFAGVDSVTLLQGDSGSVLGQLVPTLKQPALFWLDGHYSGDITARGDEVTPVMAELAHVLASPLGHVVLIDDGRLFDGSDGYPTLAELARTVKTLAPDAGLAVADDIIRVCAESRFLSTFSSRA